MNQLNSPLSWVGTICVSVIGLQLDLSLHSSLIPDGLVGSRPPYEINSWVGLGDVSWP